MFCTCFANARQSTLGTWRGTAFSRRRPLPTRTAACSRTLPLAGDAVAFFCLSSPGTRNSSSREFESSLSLARHENESSASIRHHLEGSSIVLSRNSDLVVFCTNRPVQKKKKPSRLLVFSGVLGFRVREVNPRPQQFGSSARQNTPCSLCTLQKALHMTNQPNARENFPIARMRHGLRT